MHSKSLHRRTALANHSDRIKTGLTDANFPCPELKNLSYYPILSAFGWTYRTAGVLQNTCSKSGMHLSIRCSDSGKVTRPFAPGKDFLPNLPSSWADGSPYPLSWRFKPRMSACVSAGIHRVFLVFPWCHTETTSIRRSLWVSQRLRHIEVLRSRTLRHGISIPLRHCPLYAQTANRNKRTGQSC